MQTSSPPLEPSEKLGVQEPRIHLLPAEFDEDLSRARAAEMIDLASIAGLYFDPWQETAAELLTYTRSDGRWASFEDLIEANRQNGKGSIIEGHQLTGLFVWETPLQIYTAHEFKTAQEMFLRIQVLIESTPTLDRMVRRIRTADGEESIETKSGCRLKFLARSNNSGRGFTGDTVYLDEALKLRRQMMAALMPTMSAKSVMGNPKLVYASSAPYVDSEVLTKVRLRALSGKRGRFAAAEWSARAWDELTPDERKRYGSRAAYYDDPETWRQGNPAFGIRISADFIQSERDAMEDDEFAQERLGIPSELAGAETVVELEDWSASADDGSFIVADRAFAFDVANDRSMAAVAQLGPNAAGELHMEVVKHHDGPHWVVPWLVEMFLLNSKAPRRVYLVPGGQAETMVPAIEEAGIEARVLKRGEYAAACAAVYDGVRDHSLRHRETGQVPLDVAIGGAAWSSGDARVWDRKRSSTDITSLVAVTAALWGWRLESAIEELPDILDTVG